VLDIFHAHEFERKDWREIGTLQAANGSIAERYLDALCAYLDTKAIRAGQFTVVVDPCNGAGSPLLPALAERLALRLIPINCEPTGIFPHDPEPRPRNARQIAAIMGPVSAHAGFLFNSDMSRVSVVSNVGETVTEEYTFPLVAAHVLSKRGGAVVTNCCSTKTLDDIAQQKGARVIKTPVGPAFVCSTMLDERALLAGDGSGSVAVAEFSPAMDAFLTMGLILEAMATRGRTLADLISELPRYHIVKDKIYCPAAKAYQAVNTIIHHFHSQRMRLDQTDGVRVDWPDAWVHVRASATEPLVRVIAEATTRAKALEIAADVGKVIHEKVQT
jgi:phosphomannomutase